MKRFHWPMSARRLRNLINFVVVSLWMSLEMVMQLPASLGTNVAKKGVVVEIIVDLG